jgi:hypothetical protein
MSRLSLCCLATATGFSGVPLVNRSSCESPLSTLYAFVDLP